METDPETHPERTKEGRKRELQNSDIGLRDVKRL